MDRIILSKEERSALRLLQKGEDCRPYYDDPVFCYAIGTLQEKRFARGAFVEGHTLEGLCLLNRGRAYLEEYPSLRNPIDWVWICLTLAACNLIATGIIWLCA